MSVEDRLRAAMSTMEVAAREQDEQRGLRDRRVAEAHEQASAGVQREAAAAVKYAEHMDELSKRQKKAGGWVTEKTSSDRDSDMTFGLVDEGPPPTVGYPGLNAPSASPVSGTERRRHARRQAEDDDEDFSNTNWLA